MNPAGIAAALRLIVIVERQLAGACPVLEIVRSTLKGGARAIQLRNKGDSARELFAAALELRALTASYGALFFVNDRLDVALAASADGVHLGPGDVPVAPARAAAPAGFLIGSSANDPESARRAEQEGASYIGCGTVFPTLTKPDAGKAIGLPRLRQVAQAAGIPVVGIGGITLERAAAVTTTGAAGVAVAGALMGAPNPRRATHHLIEAARTGMT